MNPSFDFLHYIWRKCDNFIWKTDQCDLDHCEKRLLKFERPTNPGDIYSGIIVTECRLKLVSARFLHNESDSKNNFHPRGSNWLALKGHQASLISSGRFLNSKILCAFHNSSVISNSRTRRVWTLPKFIRIVICKADRINYVHEYQLNESSNEKPISTKIT